MKHKKLIALIATLTLALSSMAVSAETLTGDMNYVDTTIYKVTLPTTANMTFTLDPQGLTSLDQTGNQYSDTAAGKIISTGKMTAINESSVAVDLYADFYITDSDTTSAVSLLASDGSFTEGETAKEMQLFINTTDSTTAKIDVTRTAADTNGGTKFEMEKATYTFGGNKENGYTYNLTPDSGKKIEMTIAGNIAKAYDWSAYTGDSAKTIALNAVFKFTQKGKTDEVTNTAPATPAGPTLSGTGLTAVTGKDWDYEVGFTKGTALTLNVTDGTVSDVTVASTADGEPVASANVTTTDSSITVISNAWAGAQSGSSKYVHITLEDVGDPIIVKVDIH